MKSPGKLIQLQGPRLCFLLQSLLMLLSGCSRVDFDAKFQEANAFFTQANYQASLLKNEEIMERYPLVGDRALFNMGVIYALPKHEQKDLAKSLDCFQKLIEKYPQSRYRQDSEKMIFYLQLSAMKDDMIAGQQKQIEVLQQDVEKKDREILAQGKRIETLEQKLTAMRMQNVSVEKILIEKKERRLMLVSRGEVIKTYKIALGGNPNGPKESEGDNKTPEGTYVIDSRNRDTLYHLSLHISYPNDKDRKRAKELGLPPGGDIMIHGIKNGFGWVGGAHSDVDWTQGCIAVTDEEIEEIDRLVPDGTPVEIRP